MTDNITLPREVAQGALEALVWEAGLTPTMYSAKTGRAITALRTHLAAPRPEPERHPGYVIGNHWLETAYSRVCAGEAEADVLRDCGWERVTDAEALRRDAESWRRLMSGVGSLDADMEDKT